MSAQFVISLYYCQKISDMALNILEGRHIQARKDSDAVNV